MLRVEKQSLLRHYVALPDILWQHLDETRSVVGGLGALSFFLLAPNLRPSALDIFVSSDQEANLRQRLADDEELELQEGPVRVWRPLERQEFTSLVARTRTYWCAHGRSLNIHTSTSLSPLDPIAASVTTALCNWVSASVFACGYPALTLRRRAVGRELFRRDTVVATLYWHLLHVGFEINTDPSAWDDYRALLSDADNDSQQPCMRSLYLCPTQGRFFGDPGSLVNVFVVKEIDHDALRASHQPPYGIATVWRRGRGRQACDGPCTDRDPLLPQGVFVHAVILIACTIRFGINYVGP